MKSCQSIAVAILTGLLLSDLCVADEPERQSRRSSRRSGGLFLDIGQFTPYARGITIDIGPKTHPHAKRRVNVQVGPGPYIPVDVNVNSGGGPADGSLNAIPPQTEELPGKDLLGTPSDSGSLSENTELNQPSDPFSKGPDLLGTPSEAGPTLIPPPVPPKLESPPQPTELEQPQNDQKEKGIRLEPAPLPANPIAPPVPSSISSLLQPKDIPAENPTTIRSAPGPAYLGVSAQPVSGALAAQLARTLPKNAGIQVTQVTPHSAAESAGLKKHDILVKYDNQPIGSLQDLIRLVSNNRAGDEVKLLIIRALKEQEIKVILGTRPDEISMAVPPKPYDFFYAEPPPPVEPAVVFIPFHKTPALIYDFGGITLD